MTPELAQLRDLVPDLRAGLTICGVDNAYLNPVNAAARIATGKWTIEKGAFVSASGQRHIIPAGSKKDYYARILDQAMGEPVPMVPAYMAEHFRKQPTLKVAKAEDQYLIALDRAGTEALANG